MPRKNNSSKRSSKFDPNLYVGEAIAITTADTTYNNSVFTNSEPYRQLASIRSAHITIEPGATASRVLFVLRRLPQGYSVPSTTFATGLTVWNDVPDVIGYAIAYVPSSTGNTNSQVPLPIQMTLLKPNIVLFENDQIYLNALPGVSSAGMSYNVLIEFGTRPLI